MPSSWRKPLAQRLTDMDMFYGHLLTHEARDNPDLWPYPTIDTLASSAIVVDRSGPSFHG